MLGASASTYRRHNPKAKLARLAISTIAKLYAVEKETHESDAATRLHR